MVEDQKYISNILMDRLELTKVEIHSVSWEKGGGKRLSGAVAKRKFLGPKLQSLTVAIIFELIYYTNGHSRA